MASGVTLPTFSEKEKLLHQKLNAMVEAISARFSAGISTADLTWPLVAEGNLNMSVYEIINGKKIWDIVNAGQYDTLEDAVAAAGTNGVVLVPPNTTVVTNTGATMNGATAIIGAGPSSVIQIGTASGATFALASVSGSGGWVCANLTIDGNNVASANGISLTSRTDVFLSNLRVINCTEAGVKLNAGCGTLLFSDLVFNGGSAEDIYAISGTKLLMSNISSESPDGIGIRIEATGTMRIAASNVEVNAHGTVGLQVTGSGASFSGSNVFVNSAGSGHSMVFGESGTLLGYLSLQGGEVVSGGDNGIDVYAASGVINGVRVKAATVTGIDLNESTGVTVSDCPIANAAIGIDGSDCAATCVVHGNSFDAVTAHIVDGEFLHHYNNEGVIGLPGPMGFTLPTAKPGGAYTSFGPHVTNVIPANTLQEGDVLKLRIGLKHDMSATGTWGADSFWVELNGVNIAAESAGTQSSLDMTRSFITEMTVLSNTTACSITNDNYREIIGLDFTSDQDLTDKNNMDELGGGATGTVTLVYWSWTIERRLNA